MIGAADANQVRPLAIHRDLVGRNSPCCRGSIMLAVLRSVGIFRPMSKPQPKITAYLKTFCGWSEGVRAIMRKYDLEFEEKDIIKNPAFRWEMEQRSGQSLSPCVEIDGTMLPDISGDEVEAWLIKNGYLEKDESEADAPTNSACTDEQHEAMARGDLRLPGKIKFLG